MATVGVTGAIKAPPPDSGFLGQGVKYPPTLTTGGKLATSSGTTSVEESLFSILSTSEGERPMMPKYGARIGEFEPVDVQRMIVKFRSDVADYEPRCTIVDAISEPGPGIGDTTLIITYAIKDEADEHVLTFPLFQVT